MKKAIRYFLLARFGMWDARWPLIWTLFFAVMVLAGTGCGPNGQFGTPKDPIQLVTEANTGYTAVEKAANDLRDDHAITEQQHERLRPARNTARAALLAYQTSVLRGDTNTATMYASFTAALAQFTAAVQQVQLAGPATRP